MLQIFEMENDDSDLFLRRLVKVFLSLMRFTSGQCLVSLMRFVSDANVVGAEKISAAKIPPEYLDSPWVELPSIFGGVFCLLCWPHSTIHMS